MDKEENALQNIRRVLSEDDKVSREISSSHLLTG